MTILAKPSIVYKKPDGIKSPLVVDEKSVCDEEKITVYPPAPTFRPAKRSGGALACLTVVALLVAVTGATCGLLLYRQYLRTSAVRRFQGFCTIPIDTKEMQEPQQEQLIEPNYREHRVMPLQWFSEPRLVFSSDDDDEEALSEEFDIGEGVESIRVKDNGRVTNFIHDFDDNITGIVDSERCFLMDLDQENLLPPDLFVIGIEQGEDFDVSRVRSTLRAVLPALQQLTRRLAQHCAGKPSYRLQREGSVIHKRSADAPPHDYIQFAGRHVQEIEIANMAELLDYEKNGD